MFNNINSNQKRLLGKVIEKAKDGFFTTKEKSRRELLNNFC